MNELEKLIAEQARDQRLGSYQPRDPIAPLSLSVFRDEVVDQDGHLPSSERLRKRGGCPVHGFAKMDPRHGCQRCATESRKLRYSTDAEFRERRKAQARAYYQRVTKQRRRTDPDLLERQRQASREYYRRRYATDPDFRARELARVAAYKKASA